jgi:hypothetical protein
VKEDIGCFILSMSSIALKEADVKSILIFKPVQTTVRQCISGEHSAHQRRSTAAAFSQSDELVAL